MTSVDNYIGQVIHGKDIEKSIFSKYIWTKCNRCGKEWWAQFRYNKTSKLCRYCTEFITAEIMRKHRLDVHEKKLLSEIADLKYKPKLGIIVRGNRIGKCYATKYIYIICKKCKKKWWAAYVEDKKKYLCLSCSIKGRVYSEEHNKKLSLAKLGKKLSLRSTNSLLNSYSSVHQWIRYHYGKANCCEICGSSRNIYQWANTNGTKSDGIFSRDREDYVMTCHRCHRNLDAFIIRNKYKLSQDEIIAKIRRMKNEFFNSNN